jgi:hypothetical protein
MASFEIAVGSLGYCDRFTNDGGTVEIEISQCPDPRGRYGWCYALTWNDEIVFEGDDLSTPHCDPLRALEDLAAFLTSPYRDWEGDEDADPYTELQRSWFASSECESLSWEIETLEDEDEDEDEDGEGE